MCGVFAMFLARPLRQADIELGRSATAMLRHRGPDGSGEWSDAAAGVFLGHRRLAIIDLTQASAQPMAKDGLALTYNGEIYNYRELAQRLKDRGVALRTRGDVETLLEAWRCWGSEALDKLDGMFAFALWDGRTAHLATDLFGEKPLFIAETEDGTYASSEIAPLAHLLRLEPEIGGERLCSYFALGSVYAPATWRRGVRRLPPASALTISGGRCGPLRRYWSPPLAEPGRGPVEPVGEAGLDRIAEAIHVSLKGRLISDAPLALFLSAGVDSSLAAAIASRELGVKPICATVAFPRGEVVNEAPRTEAIARHLGLSLDVLESDEDPRKVGLEGLLDLLHEPHDNVSAFSVQQLSRAVAGRYKAALTGVGGDEVSWGYGKHAELYRSRRRYGAPEWLRLTLAAAGGASRALARLSAQYGVRDEERFLALKTYPAIAWLRELPGFAGWARATFGGGDPAWLAVPRHELAVGLPNDQLIVYDHASMREGLELRTPYLSRAVVETMASFDPRALLAFGQKSVLRRLLARYLPRPLFDHPKSGFRFPLEIFLRGCGEEPPCVPGLSPRHVEAAWSRRFQGHGWQRIAVRLAAASAFLGTHKGRGVERWAREPA